MAKLEPNTIIGILNGKLGDVVFVRHADGTITVKRRPVRVAKFTEPELVSQGRFAQAIAYVRQLMLQPDAYSVYKLAAKVAGKRACDLANADFRHCPQIEDVDLSCFTGRAGATIRVQAVDDFEVVSVGLALTRLNGTLLESGEAVGDKDPSRWLYTAQTNLPVGESIMVNVTVMDRPGNASTKTLHYAPWSPS